MRSVDTLIDECVKVCGSQSALARRIGLSQAAISLMQKRPDRLTPAAVGLLCGVLDIDGTEASRLALEAVIATAPPGKQGVLRRAFFACSAMLAAFSAAPMIYVDDSRSTAQAVASAAIPTAGTTAKVPGLYIMSTRLRAWLLAQCGALLTVLRRGVRSTQERRYRVPCCAGLIVA